MGRLLSILILFFLVACCPPTTQALDSSFTGKVSAQLGPNQYIVMYGSRPLTLIFEQSMKFEIGQNLYIQGQIAGDIIRVNQVTPID